MSSGNAVMKSVTVVMSVVILVLVSALIVGNLLSQSVFSSLTIINTTELSNNFSAFVTALIGFFSVIGVIVAIVWLITYIKPLFDKKTGIQTFGGS